MDAAVAGDNGSGEDEYADMPPLERRDQTAVVAADSAAVACENDRGEDEHANLPPSRGRTPKKSGGASL